VDFPLGYAAAGIGPPPHNFGKPKFRDGPAGATSRGKRLEQMPEAFGTGNAVHISRQNASQVDRSSVGAGVIHLIRHHGHDRKSPARCAATDACRTFVLSYTIKPKYALNGLKLYPSD